MSKKGKIALFVVSGIIVLSSVAVALLNFKKENGIPNLPQLPRVETPVSPTLTPRVNRQSPNRFLAYDKTSPAAPMILLQNSDEVYRGETAPNVSGPELLVLDLGNHNHRVSLGDITYDHQTPTENKVVQKAEIDGREATCTFEVKRPQLQGPISIECR